MADDAEDAEEMQAELADWISTADDSEIDELSEFLAKPYFSDDNEDEPEEIEGE